MYKYSKMNDMENILDQLELPKKLKGARTILTILAMTNLEENDRWNHLKQDFMRPHDIILYINKYYPRKGEMAKNGEGYAENSRESFRKDSIIPLCDLAILEGNDEKSNSGNTSYRITKEFASLLKKYNSSDWDDELIFYKAHHDTYAQKYSQKKNIDKGLPVTFKGTSFILERSKHNKLQMELLDSWVPRFAPGAELLYIGDTKDRIIVKNDEMINQLNIKVIENNMLPDIILYEEGRGHKWLLFIEAYSSTGEMSIERVYKLKNSCMDCPSDVELIFLTAVQDMKTCMKIFKNIAWDTEIWVADEETHMIHKNGDKFLSGHEK